MRLRRRSRRRTARALAVGFIGLAAAAVAGGFARAHRRGATSGASAGARTRDDTFTCECGQKLRFTGEGRHRVFWLPDAAADDPLLEDKCPSCERELSTQPG